MSIFCFSLLTTPHSVFAAVQNTVTITDKSGNGVTNYPLQFGRPFVQGEITNTPQVLLNGSPIATQADIKNRYPDGSVKYAIISIVIPRVQGNGAVTLSFKNSSITNNTPLTKEQMLDVKFNFDAKITLTNGSSQSASARTMLANGDYTLWTSGPVAQTILLADDTTARKYDMGFDSNKSVRPRFYATFWPSLNKVTVRVVGENTNTISLQDVSYDLSLSTGFNGSQNVYTKKGLIHPFLTRWNKTYWIGGEPEQKINIDNNLPYLIDTKYFPNFDTLVTIPESTIAGSYSSWNSSPRDLYEKGLWTIYMPTTGGRSDIGPFTAWTMQWLYSGDWRARTVALGLGDLASAWPLHAREGSSAKKIDKAQTTPALGLPISVYAYPTVWIPDNNGSYASLTVKSTRIPTDPKVYPGTGHGWVPDGAHQPDPFYAQYILTGDFYYLEEAQMWASTQALGYCVGGSWCRGSSGMAGIQDQIRGNAWVFRNRANAAFMTPDSMGSLKSFYTQITTDAIALWEGKAGVTGTALQNSAEWKWANNAPLGNNPLHFQGCSKDATPYCEMAPWMQYYFMSILGIQAERGFPVQAYSTWLNGMLTSQFADKNYNIYNVASYHIQVKNTAPPENWIQSWADIQKQNIINKAMVAAGNFSVTGSGAYYPILATAAASFMTGQANGKTAWDFLHTNVKQASLSGSASVPSWYKGFYDGTGEGSWNIIPRGFVETVAPPKDPTPEILPIEPLTNPLPVTPTKPATTSPTTPIPATPTKPAPAPQTPTVLPTTQTPSVPLVTNTTPLWGADAATQVATTPSATLKVAKGITRVQGLSGNNIVILTTPNSTYAYKSHFKITYNKDGSVSIKDNHSTGFTVMVHNIQKVIFPSGDVIFLDGSAVVAAMSAAIVPKAPVTPTPAIPAPVPVSTPTVRLTPIVRPVTPDVPTPAPTPVTPTSLAVAPVPVTTAPITTTPVAQPVTAPVTDPAPVTAFWRAAPDVLTATTPDATLTATDGITKVQGIGGTNNTVVLTKPNKDAYKSWFKITYNSNGSVTIQDVHATGYTVTVYGIQKIIFPTKETLTLSAPTSLRTLKESFATVNGVVKRAGNTISGRLMPTQSASAQSCITLNENMHRGNETSAVNHLQNFLISKGLLNQQVSGFFGDFTVAAVKTYQKSVGLPATGMVYDATREAIMTETCQ